jgi:hypothetical protein
MAENKALNTVMKDFGTIAGAFQPAIKEGPTAVLAFAEANKEKVLALFQGQEAALLETKPLPTQAMAWVDNHRIPAYAAGVVRLNAVYDTGMNLFRLGRWVVGMFRGTI